MKGRLLITFVIVVSLLLTGTMAAMAQEQKKDESKAEEQSEELTLIDINSATLEELTELPGVGETIGQRIIDARPYAKPEELIEKVKGIGEKGGHDKGQDRVSPP